MSQKTHIYVDLELETETSATNNRFPSQFYLDNQNLVINCDENNFIGSEDEPLTFNEFRNYLLQSHILSQSDREQVFHLKGSRDIRDASFKDIPLVLQTIGLGGFCLFSNRQSKVTITNWEFEQVTTNTFNVQSPWRIIWNDDFAVSNKLELLNGEIEIIDNRRFQCITTTDTVDNKKLLFNNMKVFVSKQFDTPDFFDRAVDLAGWDVVDVINSLFHNKDRDGGFFYLDDDSAGLFYIQSNFNINFINSIFTGFSSFWTSSALTDTIFRTESCLFSESESKIYSIDRIGFWNIPGASVYVASPYENLFNRSNSQIDDNSQFNFVIPSILDDDLTTLDETDFYYLDDDWYGDNISVKGYTDNTFNVNNSFGRRDGIGPLIFPEMLDFNILIDPTPSILNEESNLTINYWDFVDEQIKTAQQYESQFQPSSFIWDFGDNNTLTTTDTTVTHTYTVSRIFTVHCDIVSHNEWYVISSELEQNVQLDVLGSIDIKLFRVKQIMGEKIYDDEITTSASTLDLIALSATNNTSVDVGIQIFSRVNVDFSEKNTTNMNYITSGFSDFLNSGGSFISEMRYLIAGVYDIYVSAIQIDGRTVTEKRTLIIHPHIKKEYYVDLSLDGEISGNFFINDDFTDGIDENWNNTFVDNYDVVDMFGNAIAVDSSFRERVLMYNVGRNGFASEFSFYRNERFDIPEFNIYRPAGFPNNLIKILWDYNEDNIRVVYRSGATGSVVIKDVHYKIPSGFVKDLRCPNSLRELHFRIENQNNNFVIQYSFDENNWIYVVTEDEDWIILSEIISISTKSSSTVGFNYINLQSNIGLPYGFGTPENPFSYQTFRRRIESSSNDINNVNIGGFNDVYRCKNYRVIDRLRSNSDKFFEITSWYDNLNPEQYRNLGPWMLIIFNMSRGLIGDDFFQSTRFIGTRISNGIIYNLDDSSFNLRSTNNLYLSFAYNMFIVWQGRRDHIRVIPSKWINREYDYREIVGSTIKTRNTIRGF